MTKALIEKLENEIAEGEAILASIENMPSLFTLHTGTMAGLNMALDIVKQHSDWIPCSERLPETSGKYLVFYFQEFHDGTYFKKLDVVSFYAGTNRFDFYHSLISHWQPIQPPSEVQA